MNPIAPTAKALATSAPYVFINGTPLLLNATTGRPDIGPATHIVNDRGMPVLGPLRPGECYKLVSALNHSNSLDWASSMSLKMERKKWEKDNTYIAQLTSGAPAGEGAGTVKSAGAMRKVSGTRVKVV